MSEITLTRVLEQIETLELEELTIVEHTIQRLKQPHIQTEGRASALRVLEAAGLIKPTRPSMGLPTNAPAVSITGKPLSETIIEERQ